MKEIDWNVIAELGLLERINREIMHPLGLAVYRQPKDGTSGGALVSPDGVFEYGDIESKIQPPSKTIEKIKKLNK